MVSMPLLSCLLMIWKKYDLNWAAETFFHSPEWHENKFIKTNFSFWIFVLYYIYIFLFVFVSNHFTFCRFYDLLPFKRNPNNHRTRISDYRQIDRALNEVKQEKIVIAYAHAHDTRENRTFARAYARSDPLELLAISFADENICSCCVGRV